MPNILSSMPAVCTSSSSFQAHLLPSTFSLIPTIQSQSRLPIPISTNTTATLDNSLSTSASSLSTKTHVFPTTSKNFATLSTEVQPSVPLPDSAMITSNSKPTDTSKIPKNVKTNSKNRRKCTKVEKPEIAKKRPPHEPRKLAPKEYATHDEDMIVYDVEEDEFKPIPADEFILPEFCRKNPH
ncbi:hypothetical protein TNCV_476301 [Trichonephila clavipes]|nr:hypothetical protein TNCV_476301 [Trichonephila clavipes]